MTRTPEGRSLSAPVASASIWTKVHWPDVGS